MKCPECVATGQRSRVYPGARGAFYRGEAPFYDEDGVFHRHGTDTERRDFSCSIGHQWTERTERRLCLTDGCTWAGIVSNPEEPSR